MSEAEIEAIQSLANELQDESNEMSEINVSSIMRYATKKFIEEHEESKTLEVMKIKVPKSKITIEGVYKIINLINDIGRDYEDETGAYDIAADLQGELFERIPILNKRKKGLIP